MSAFAICMDTAVVTTTYVARERRAVLDVTCEDDEDGGVLWQFHCGNGDYRNEVLQLVALREVLELDPGLGELGDLPVGSRATRSSVDAPWDRKDLTEVTGVRGRFQRSH